MKKLYISADIEGISGVCDWDATKVGGAEYEEGCKLMTNEVLATCRGAFKAGYDHVVIKDAHNSGRNITPSLMPEKVTLIRSWSGHPYCMMQELDQSFDASIMIGYHSCAGSSSNPLAHSFTGRIALVKLNERPVSEFYFNTLISWYEKVPVALVSGDEALCSEVENMNCGIMSHPVSKGMGMSSITLSHSSVCKEREEMVEEALRRKEPGTIGKMDKKWKLEVSFNTPYSAYGASYYPGARLKNDITVSFESGDFFEILRARKFIMMG